MWQFCRPLLPPLASFDGVMLVLTGARPRAKGSLHCEGKDTKPALECRALS